MMINGRNISEIFEELGKPFPTKQLEGGSTYIKIDDIKNRLYEVLAPWNLRWEITDGPRIINVRESYAVSLRGRLTILSDEGEVVACEECGEFQDITFKKDDGTRVSDTLSSVEGAAESHCLKKCLNALGIAREVSYAKKGTKKSGETVSFSFKTPISGNSKRLSAQVVKDGKEYEFVIFESGIKAIREKYPDRTEADILTCLKKYGPNGIATMKAVCTIGEYQGKAQLIFVSY